MSKNSSVEHQFVSKWHQAKELPLSEAVDQSIEQSVLEAFDKHHSNGNVGHNKAGRGWLYAIAASLFIAIMSWQFVFQKQLSNNELSQPNKLLLSAIAESKQLEASFEVLKRQSLSEFVYVQKFQLEKELLLINYKLAEAYNSQGDVQDKLQLWHQKNQKLSQLNALMVTVKSTAATHI